MNQKKIGRFLKELRKEMGITQEEFAEKLDVSSRTISRWETGANMPDISLLVNIAEIFNVSIPEIINGERKSEIMEKETKKVAEAMSDYATAEKAVVLKRVKSSSFPNTISGVVYQQGAFTAVSDGQINLSPNQTAYNAARDALNGWDPCYGAIYYFNPNTATNAWIWSRPHVITIGKHRFCK